MICCCWQTRELPNIRKDSSKPEKESMVKAIYLGIRVPVLRKLVNKYRGISLVEVSKLLHSKFHEERLLAVLMLVQLFKTGGEEEQKTFLYLENTKSIYN